jgi:preprotein translocase subunit SecG
VVFNFFCPLFVREINMMVSPVLAVSFFMDFVAVVFVICAVVLMLVVLIQKGKGGGLGAAFGGGLASGILGSKTGDFLTWVTIAMVGVFLVLAVVMAKFYKPSISDSGPTAAGSTASGSAISGSTAAAAKFRAAISPRWGRRRNYRCKFARQIT